MATRSTRTAESLDRWHGGDSDGLDALLEDHLPWLMKQVQRRLTQHLRRKGDTADFVQDAVVQFLRFCPRFHIDNDRHFRAILLKIVESTMRNQYDWLTARRREIARERPLARDTVLRLDPPRGEVKTPSMHVVNREREAWIRLGLELLDCADREVIVLRKWDGLTFVEAGERMGITEDAARMRHNRAVRRLAEVVARLRTGDVKAALDSAQCGPAAPGA